MRDSRELHGPIILALHAGQFVAVQHIRSFDRAAEHKVFHAMWTRCTNPNHISFERYGARGVTVCDRWKNFAYFFVDMGPRPTPKHTIERRDNTKGYEPDNCYWATQRQQSVNKSNTVFIVVDGERTALWEYAERVNAPLKLLRNRLKIGWSLEDAVATPVRPCKRGPERKPTKKYKSQKSTV